MKKYLIVLASGTGSRFGGDTPKQFLKIAGKMVIEYTLQACDCGLFDKLILVVSEPYVDEMRALFGGRLSLPIVVVSGGASRQESCARGVAVIPDDDALVVIHNGVQPFVGKKTFERCLKALEKYSVVTSGAPCVYTVLETDEVGVLRHMAPRSHCFNDLGPECFRLTMLRKVIGMDESGCTNLSGVVVRHHLSEVFVVAGEPTNIKITYPNDLILAERLFGKEEVKNARV